jgi:kynurenine formamidase
MKGIFCALLFVVTPSLKFFAAAEEPTLWAIQQTIISKKFINLTHEFAPGIPRWPGFPDETRKTIYWYDKRPDTMGMGFFAEVFTLVGQRGTHVDPPAHFIKGLRTVDQIDPKEMFLPLAVIDVHEEAAKNPELHTDGRAFGETGERSWSDPGWCLRGHADGLDSAVGPA